MIQVKNQLQIEAMKEDLADITGGQITSQETLNNIFQHFCVGK